MHFKCRPGTESDVNSMVTHRNRKTDPNIEKNRRNMMLLYLWNNNVILKMTNSASPQYSHIAKAHGINGTLSSTISVRVADDSSKDNGEGGKFVVSDKET